MNTREKIISLYYKPQELKLERKNLKIEFSDCLFANYNQAKIRIKIKDYYSALLLCNKCLEINDTFVKAILLKAYIFFELDDYYRAYSNALLADNLEEPSKHSYSLTILMFRRYLVNGSIGRRIEIINYLDHFKEIWNEFDYDI